MSVVGRLIADVLRLRQLSGVSLFLLVAGGNGAGKSTVLQSLTSGLTTSCEVKEASTLRDLLSEPPVNAPGPASFTVCFLTYSIIAAYSGGAVGSQAPIRSIMAPYTVVVLDDVDLLWTLCVTNRHRGTLEYVLRLLLSSPSTALVASAPALDAVPRWLLELKTPITYSLRELTEASMRRLLRAVPHPEFTARTRELLGTQTLSTSRTLLLFNACMTLNTAAKGLAAEGISAYARASGAFLHHHKPPTEARQHRRRRLFGVEELTHRLQTLLSVFTSHNGSGGVSAGRLLSSLPPSTGILLHGPSGCGKSCLAQQLADDFPALPFFTVECTRLFSKYLGESEEQLREVYRRARVRAPAVVVLEDIDVIAQSRGAMHSSESGKGGVDVTKRMLAGLLCELDGVTDNSGVLTVGVTNAPHVLDSAVLRQGRLETLLYVPPLAMEGAVAMCDEFFGRFSGDEENRAMCVKVLASAAVGCAAASLHFILRKVLELMVGRCGWPAAGAAEQSLSLPSLADLHGLLFAHSSMLAPVRASHFE